MLFSSRVDSISMGTGIFIDGFVDQFTNTAKFLRLEGDHKLKFNHDIYNLGRKLSRGGLCNLQIEWIFAPKFSH